MAAPVAGYEPVTPVVEGESVTQRRRVIYFDTRDRRLAGAYLTLRRRTGGQDAGWHLKVPVRGAPGRRCGLPLGRATVTVPDALRKMVWALALWEPLAPVAAIVTGRTVRHLIDAGRELLAEPGDADAFVDRAHRQVRDRA